MALGFEMLRGDRVGRTAAVDADDPQGFRVRSEITVYDIGVADSETGPVDPNRSASSQYSDAEGCAAPIPLGAGCPLPIAPHVFPTTNTPNCWWTGVSAEVVSKPTSVGPVALKELSLSCMTSSPIWQ
jgi:hypothetical protein